LHNAQSANLKSWLATEPMGAAGMGAAAMGSK
jgi:hypothetical protein